MLLMSVPEHYCTQNVDYTNNMSQHYCKTSHNTQIVHILCQQEKSVLTRTLNIEGGAVAGSFTFNGLKSN